MLERHEEAAAKRHAAALAREQAAPSAPARSETAAKPPPSLCELNEIASPFVRGFWNPVINTEYCQTSPESSAT